MAAPESVTIRNLQGRWVMNSSLSDAFDPVLALQGIGWLTRKALGVATVNQALSQSTVTGEDDQPTTKILIDQTITGGLKGTSETRILDWHYRGHTDWLFGTVQGRSRYTTLAEVVGESKSEGLDEEDAKYLAEGWLKETEEGEIIQSFVDNEGNKWTALQVWGFAEVGGKRMFVRRTVARRKDKDEVKRVRLVYDYVGTLE
ncbi:hypothetical protein NX059_004015 [Plenodomus lindquistii]|nr:hypothetical protein NX059_004015 [Plenodomus lindquistii]